MNLRRLLTIILLGTFTGTMSAAENADATFHRAEQKATTELTEARELYRLAALRYLKEATERPGESGPLLYNAGNAFFLAGDRGRAVVAYRRSERLMPGSSLLRDNLAFVRKQSGNIQEKPSESHFNQAFFWQWNPALLWVLLLLAWLFFAAALFQRQWSNHRLPRLVPKIALAVAVCIIGALVFQQIQAARRCRGVIVTAAADARKGPNYGYAPAFTAPLEAGVEFDVIGHQNDWLHLQLDSFHQSWVKKDEVEIWQGNIP